jgi:hypothetical protein
LLSHRITHHTTPTSTILFYFSFRFHGISPLLSPLTVKTSRQPVCHPCMSVCLSATSACQSVCLPPLHVWLPPLHVSLSVYHLCMSVCLPSLHIIISACSTVYLSVTQIVYISQYFYLTVCLYLFAAIPLTRPFPSPSSPSPSHVCYSASIFDTIISRLPVVCVHVCVCSSMHVSEISSKFLCLEESVLLSHRTTHHTTQLESPSLPISLIASNTINCLTTHCHK